MENVKLIGDSEKFAFFKVALAKKMKEYYGLRQLRPEPRPGYHYKRDWFDRMGGTIDQFNVKFFLEHIADIWNGTSKLNSETRTVIKGFCDAAMNEVVLKEVNTLGPSGLS